MTTTLKYKFLAKCPINNIPDRELFKRLNNGGKAVVELKRRGYD